MKSFEANGVWFLPEAPDTQIPGAFEFSAEKGLTLKLSGAFQQHWSFEGAEYAIVKGAIDDSPYGKFVTLFNCYATNLTFGMPRVTAETIHANYGFAGTEFVDSDDTLFDGLQVQFPVVRADIPVCRKRRIENSALVESVAPSTSHSKCLGALPKIASSLGLKAWLKNPGLKFEQTRYTLFKSRNHFDRLHVPAVKTSESRLRSIDLLFSLDDVKDRFGQFTQKWFEFVKRHPDFCTIFFAYGYEQHGFVDTRFLFLMQAAECLIREESGNNEVVASFKGMRETFLKHKLLAQHPEAVKVFPSATQMAMPVLFAQLIASHWALIADIAGTTHASTKAAIFATLEYVNSRGPKPEGTIRGANLYWLLTRLRAVLKILCAGPPRIHGRQNQRTYRPQQRNGASNRH